MQPGGINTKQSHKTKQIRDQKESGGLTTAAQYQALKSNALKANVKMKFITPFFPILRGLSADYIDIIRECSKLELTLS